jgi:NADH-quinone oxidoreductase subunit G
MGMAAGTRVRIRQGGGEAILPVLLDPLLPEGIVRVARGVPETAALGEGEVAIDIVQVSAAA